MPIIAELRDCQQELTAIRRDIHAHPELAFAELRTADLVAAKLGEFGCAVDRGLAGTGVVGTIRCGNSNAAIGLRADMDALPIHELNDFAHRSTADGRMHACGHDGHTAMLLGAAKYLAATRNFDGTVHLIFQPAEEGGAGGRIMVEEGLFDRFRCDAVFALHNKPGIPVGQVAATAGPLLAASDRWDIRVKGRGTHAAYPHLGTDPFVIGAEIVLALQTIAGRSLDPLDAAVVSVGFMKGGSAYNVIPDELHIGGTARSLLPRVQDVVERRIGEIARGAAAAHGAEAEIVYYRNYPATINHPAETEFAAAVAAEICGVDGVIRDLPPSLGGEDFSFMLNARPGAMLWLGNGSAEGDRVLHNARYDFNDAALPIGASFLARLAERFLEKSSG
jgi:amidohydrolase